MPSTIAIGKRLAGACLALAASLGCAEPRPNILWLVAEDLSPYLGPFGDATVETPNLARLATEGVRFTNVFSVSGVCAPSRAALATGTYPTSIGAHHMRTAPQQPEARQRGLIDYEAVPPPEVRMVSEILRQHGYYAANNAKEDYQFQPSAMAWDESSLFAHWRNRPAGQPFFAVFNFGVTHEGQIWGPAPKWNLRYEREVFPPDRHEELVWRRFAEGEEKPLAVPADLDFEVPPYLPDTPAVRRDILQMYSNIVEMDRQVGVVLDQLEADGLAEETIVVWFSDHGGPLPRQKRLLYDSGLHVPMIVRYPDREGAGTRDEQLVSFVDFAPTLLSWAGIAPPAAMQGRAFAGPAASDPPRRYVFAAADRFDGYTDRIRAARDSRFKYLRNFRPDQGYYLPLAYREQMATMQELLRLRAGENLSAAQAQWFRAAKPAEELFDTQADPHELNNLAGDPRFREELAELRQAAEQWMAAVGDLGSLPERDLIERFWPGREQPKTVAPAAEFDAAAGVLSLASATPGASIGYRRAGEASPTIGWQVYAAPIKPMPGATIEAIAHRLGFAPSPVTVWSPTAAR